MTVQDCPSCKATLPVNQGYITWCDKCDWNLQGGKPAPPNNLLDAIYAGFNRRLSRGLFDKLVKAPSLNPTLTLSKAIAYLLASMIHGFTLVLLLLGLVFVFFFWPYLIVMAIGGAFLGAAWMLAPKPPKLDTEANIVPREEFPTLYSLVDRVAQELNSTSIDTLVINEQYNAAFGQFGWRRKKVLFLGLPYFSILGRQERVALLGHEIAHMVNGDTARGFFVGTAIQALSTWHGILRPDYLTLHGYAGDYANTGCAVVIANYFMRALAWPVLGLLHMMAQLLWRDSQRAEYLADGLAARVGGSDAIITSLEKFQFVASFQIVAQRVATYFEGRNLFEDLREKVSNVPERELERIRRVARIPVLGMATTHPPTAYRIEMLNAHHNPSPKVLLTEDESRKIDEELATLEEILQAKIVNTRQEYLY